MSHTAHIRSHRKPRRSASKIAMRAGVAGGVLSTLAVAGASASASAAESETTQTLELPTLTADLSAQVAQSAEATQLAAANFELQAERDAAAAKAAQQAEKNLAEAKKKEAEAKKKAEEDARRVAAERASRSSGRATLAAPAAPSASTASTSASTATGSAATVVAFVKAQVGDAYVSGGTGPSSWDCSGLVQAAFKQVGVDLPRVSQSQSTAGTQVSLNNLQPGDILYWGGAGSAYHVAVYVGGGMFVGAQNPSSGVVEKPLSYDPPSGAVRVL
ncbi:MULTISPECIES: C40 family peptidase [unclassified Streptomyces]|uniref:C40 family peptidase n=1 Tax=unclassified Streptomyces TaxID=2593676 RepID=UPI001F04069C|nr:MULTISPECIES: C40 family peptidase [unclassified Streptomyces]MCH0563190.1 C40 family peptidase [Streptomyces sp. MUM 2J]MCH0568619.1 C40 family peptidase [Streptomyces sp. MUM 136J]